MLHLLVKQIGETPLETLERFRSGNQALAGIPMTYAGRLDPMAEGLLLALSGDDCKKKEEYLGLDKVYEADILFGVCTDTHDLLGIPENSKPSLNEVNNIKEIFATFVGKRSQTYPAYSSKPHNGTPLFQLARDGQLPDTEDMPSREVEIYSIDLVSERKISAENLLAEVQRKISLVKGDFRQGQILARWEEVLASQKNQFFPIVKVKIACSSGTYVRVLANEIGKLSGLGALAFSIKRVSVGPYTLDEAKQ